MDIAGNWEGSTEGTVSFFFSDFSDSHGAHKMFRAFALYRKVVEVVIPPRRNKWGKRFGFARFVEVHDPRLFAVKLDNIIFGANKIHVNIPRFGREKPQTAVDMKKRSAGFGGGRPLAPPMVCKEWRPVLDRPKHGGMTYADVVNTNGKHGRTEEKCFGEGCTCDNGRPLVSPFGQAKDVCEVRYNNSDEEMELFKKMYVVVVKDVGSTYMVQEWLHMQGVFSIKVTPLGATLVLLEESEEGMIQALLEDAKEWINEFFEDIRQWNPKEIDKERVVWVRCYICYTGECME